MSELRKAIEAVEVDFEERRSNNTEKNLGELLLDSEVDAILDAVIEHVPLTMPDEAYRILMEAKEK